MRHEASAPRRGSRWIVKIRGCRGVDTSAEPRYARNGQRWRRGVSNSKSTTRAGAAAVTGSFSVRGGQAQAVACGRTLRFYISVFAQKVGIVQVVAARSSAFSREARYLLAFAFKLIEGFSGDRNEELQHRAVLSPCGDFPNVRTMPSNFSCLVGRPWEGETLKEGESGLP